MLRRLGNKKKLLPKLLPLFPENITTFIDMFMGSGSVTFAMVDRCKYVIANDVDADIFNLYQVVNEQKDELLESLKTLPVHNALFQYWREHYETDPIKKAVRFLMLSNFGYLGKQETLSFTVPQDCKAQTLREIKNTYFSTSIKFMNNDFREVLTRIAFIKKDFGKPAKYMERAFIHADPPYLGTGAKYAESFTEEDTRDLFSILTSSGIRFALSEFRHPLVMALAEEHGLYITSLGERRNLKNRREEILITNYQPERAQMTIFDAIGGQE